jgi:hypothetical protein
LPALSYGGRSLAPPVALPVLRQHGSVRGPRLDASRHRKEIP